MKIYKAIKADHDIQRELCNQLTETSGNTQERRNLWTKLQKELEVHAVAEERYFYAPLIDTDKMQEDARHGMAEHHEMDELIQKLNDTEMSSPGWLTTCKELAHKVNHHLDDEEQDFFPKAKDVYDAKEAEKLASGYEKTMKEYRAGWPESIPGSDTEVA